LAVVEGVRADNKGAKETLQKIAVCQSRQPHEPATLR
jgi:hypothetical protein